ncbi:MAG: hypothetical protein WDA07_14750 [Leucobacter sp.]
MADALTTAVEDAIDRVLEMQKLAVPESTEAVKRWYHVADPPYWVNAPGALGTPQGPRDATRYELTVMMRLVIGNAVDMARDETATANVQNKAWTWLPQVMRYFEKHRRLSPPGLAGLTYIAPQGATIRSMRQADLNRLQIPVAALLYTLDFELTIPFEVGYAE